ncbi:glycosyltransferase [Francisellaceae bacterium]|nr:glycosyltransferase [Francisellaceae bacterium]
MSSLIILTSNFPVSKGEEFLSVELKYAVRFYQKIYIIPDKYHSPYYHSIQNPITVHHNFSKFNFLLTLLKLPFCIFVYREFFNKKVYSSKLRFKDFLLNIYLGSKKLSMLSSLIKKNKIDIYNAEFYAYWGNWSALTLSMLKQKYICINCFAKVHGGDVFEEQQRSNYLPFRSFIYSSLDIYSISQKGINYIQTQFPLLKKRIYLSRLGTESIINVDKQKSQSFWTILSCSTVNENKRVDKILQSIQMFAKNNKSEFFKWTHIGDGPEFDLLKSIVSENKLGNLEVSLLGHQPHNFIIDFYQKNYVDVFINLSVSEGIPVTLMEATSCYVPVIAPDVGGISEVLPFRNYLIKNDDRLQMQVTKKLEVIFKSENIREIRQAHREFWERYYSAENNYQDFYHTVNVGNNEKYS